MDSYSLLPYQIVSRTPDEFDNVICTNFQFTLFHIWLICFHTNTLINTYLNKIDMVWVFSSLFASILVILASQICVYDCKIIHTDNDERALVLNWKCFWALWFFIPSCLNLILSLIGCAKLCYYGLP
ncbi:hypothetical protein DFJ63DRAFT_312586 [Scheffersomyces coipomensis]|uniref:uncharacterized protein n=1 Tax=Scheffersomyces coipomensis TaxID=1788519 RepID=UPI00315CD528